MERNDQLMNEWKQELTDLKLSTQRIAKIEAAIEETPKKRKRTPVQIVMPFAAAILALLIFAGMPQMNETTTTAGETFSILQPLNAEKIGWATAANLFVVINYCLMIAVVQKVPRLAHVPMFEAFKNRMNKRQIWQLIFATMFFAALGWIMVLVLPFGLAAVQTYMALLFMPFVPFIQLLLTRNNEWPTCGHCGEIVSKKTMRKRNTWGTVVTCDHCEKPLYTRMADNYKSLPLNFFIPMIIFIPQLTSFVHIVALIVLVLVYIVVVFIMLKYIQPYTVVFTNDDKEPPLW